MTLRSVLALEKEIEELERQEHGNPEPDEEEEEGEVVEPSTPASTETNEEKGWAKRYADLRRLQQATAEENKRLKAEKNDSATPSVTREQVEAWVKSNPKAADIVKALALEVSPKGDVEEIKEEIAKTRAMNTILKAHADFEEVTESDEFHEWADKQPASVQALVYSDKAEDVIWALDFYKSQKDKGTDPKKSAARLVKTKTNADKPTDENSRTYSESMVEKMSLADYEKHEKAILEAQKNGNFIYDRSGGAR